MVQPFWKIVRQFLKKLNINLPAIPFLVIYLKEMKTYVYTKTCMQMFVAALFLTATEWKQPKSPSTDKYTDYIKRTIKRNEVPIHATTWSSLARIMLNKNSRTQRPHTGWHHLYGMCRKGKPMETGGRLVVARGWGWDWGVTVNGREWSTCSETALCDGGTTW